MSAPLRRWLGAALAVVFSSTAVAQSQPFFENTRHLVTLDRTFGINGVANYVWDGTVGRIHTATMNDGRILFVVHDDLQSRYMLWRFTERGQVDPTFGNFGGVGGSELGPGFEVRTLAAPYGKAVVLNDRMATRFNVDGTRDTTFGANGVLDLRTASVDTALRDARVDSQGRLVVSTADHRGTAGNDALIRRFNYDGTPDVTFANVGAARFDFDVDDSVQATTLGAGDAVVSVLYSPHTQGPDRVARLRPDGSPDPLFGNSGFARVTAYDRQTVNQVRELPDGKVLMSRIGHYFAVPSFELLRLDVNGQPDVQFGVDGQAHTVFSNTEDRLFNFRVEPDGSILAAGSVRYDGKNWLGVARFNPDGTLNQSFGDEGRAVAELPRNMLYFTGITFAHEGDLLVYGPGSGNLVLLARYNVVPEPSALLTCAAVSAFVTRRRPARKMSRRR